MATGEAVITAMLRAVDRNSPFILFTASGGARMQEGILSLMQMPRTTIAVQRLREAKLPYIVVLTDPTTGGVTASYAMLGDIHIAEPGALICFAGPRVIQQTIREQLPDGFQRSEYLLSHGMIDMVVHRHKMRETLSRVCSMLMHGRPATKSAVKRTNGQQPHMNGAVVDGKLIESSVIEPEPVEGPERFKAAQTIEPTARDKTKRDGGASARAAQLRHDVAGSRGRRTFAASATPLNSGSKPKIAAQLLLTQVSVAGSLPSRLRKEG